MLAALDGINAALAVHLGDEETTIVPVMERTLTQAEVDWFGEHGRKATPKGQLWNQLGAILAAQPDGGDQWMRKNLPGPGAAGVALGGQAALREAPRAAHPRLRRRVRRRVTAPASLLGMPPATG